MARIQAVMSNCFQPYSLEEALCGIARAGFKNVEIAAAKGDCEHLDADDLTPCAISRVKHALNRYGLAPVGVDSGRNDVHTSAGFYRVRRVIDAAAELGAPIVGLFPGEVRIAGEYVRLTRNLSSLADEARASGVQLCLETGSPVMTTAKAGIALLENVGHPSLQITFDTANVVYHAGVSPEADIEHALPRLGHIHLKDQRGGKGSFNFPPPGEGELDLGAVLAILSRAGFSGSITMEIHFGLMFPKWSDCLAAVERGKKHWDALVNQRLVGSP